MAAGRDACGALLTWLQSFDPPSPCSAPPDLASGVTLAHVLHKIDPSWFSQAWLGQIRDDAEGSARNKVNNLRQVLQSVLEYWQDVLGQAVGEQHVPDVAAAAGGDPEQLVRLVRLVLGCAVSCRRREEHIQSIMGLQEGVQREVMAAIQELLDPEPPEPMGGESVGSFDSQVYFGVSLTPLPPVPPLLLPEPGAPRGRGGGGAALPGAGAAGGHAAGGEGPPGRREPGAAGAAGPGGRRRRRPEAAAAADAGGGAAGGELQAGERQRGAAGAVLTAGAGGAGAAAPRAGAQRGGERGAGAARRDGAAQGLLGAGGPAGGGGGHVPRARGGGGRAAALGAGAGGAPRRTGAPGSAPAAAAGPRPGRLRAAGGRPQVEELSGQQAEAALRAEKWHLEFRHLQERFDALSQEKERLLEERDALREANEELRCVQVQQSYLSQTDTGPAPPQNLAAEILPAELRDTVTRLRRENRRLRLQRDQLQHRLEAAEPRLEQGRLQEEFLLLDETPEDLDELPEGEEEEEEEELKPPRAGSGFRGPTRSPPKNPSASPGDPPRTPPLAPVLQLLRSQLQEKDALIRHLENDWERSRAQREREEKLLVTAWYNMGLALQQQEGGTPSRALPSGAQSFLAQQRLATVARRARAPHGRAPLS